MPVSGSAIGEIVPAAGEIRDDERAFRLKERIRGGLDKGVSPVLAEKQAGQAVLPERHLRSVVRDETDLS